MCSVDSNAKQTQFAWFTCCGDLCDFIVVHVRWVRSAQAVSAGLDLKFFVKHFILSTIKIALYIEHINKTAKPMKY